MLLSGKARIAGRIKGSGLIFVEDAFHDRTVLFVAVTFQFIGIAVQLASPAQNGVDLRHVTGIQAHLTVAQVGIQVIAVACADDDACVLRASHNSG